MGKAELWAEIGDKLDESFLTPDLRDGIDNALCALVRAERREVLDCLVIGIDNDEFNGLEAYVRRPLG
jgi:hypothetical protein